MRVKFRKGVVVKKKEKSLLGYQPCDFIGYPGILHDLGLQPIMMIYYMCPEESKVDLDSDIIPTQFRIESVILSVINLPGFYDPTTETGIISKVVLGAPASCKKYAKEIKKSVIGIISKKDIAFNKFPEIVLKYSEMA